MDGGFSTAATNARTIWSRVTRPSRLALSRAPPVSRSADCPCSRVPPVTKTSNSLATKVLYRQTEDTGLIDRWQAMGSPFCLG